MENSESITNTSKPTSWLLISIILVLILGLLAWLLTPNDQSEPVVIVDEPVIESLPEEIPPPPSEILEPEALAPEIAIEIPEVIEVVEEDPLPSLDESDSWLQKELLSITWRKELLKLVIDDDMIRRFVVFTDNFSQGILAYKYSPLVAPQSTFSAIETNNFDEKNQQEWQWDANSERRFTLYVDLLRSLDSDSLIKWYIEIKPLIDQAYAELGYPDDDFTETLLSAITRVLDMELPKSSPKIIRPSVMYKYQDPEVEALDDVDKLLLRLGRENVLVIKSVLLEISEKLSREIE